MWRKGELHFHYFQNLSFLTLKKTDNCSFPNHPKTHFPWIQGKINSQKFPQLLLNLFLAKIFVVPEAATLLFTGGARFGPNWTTKQIIEFEANKIKTQ